MKEALFVLNYEVAKAPLTPEMYGAVADDSRLNRLLKSKPFPVVDILTWSDKEKDEAVIAYLQDMGERGFAATYKMSGTSDKNRHYQSYESAIRELIDQFNEVNL